MTVFEYVVNSITWSLAGFVAGFTIARVMTRTLHSHQSNVRVLGVVLVLLAILTVAQSAFFVWKQGRCNEAFTEQIIRRAQYSDEDRRALQLLIISVFESDADKAQERAYRQWLKVTRENQQARMMRPLPKLADCD